METLFIFHILYDSPNLLAMPFTIIFHVHVGEKGAHQFLAKHALFIFISIT